MTKTCPKPNSEPAAPSSFSFSAPVCLPRGDGTFVVSPGKPISRLSVRQAAARAGVSIGTIYRLIGEGLLKADRPSRGRILVDAESLEQHLAGTRDPEFWEGHPIVAQRHSGTTATATQPAARISKR